MKHKRVPIFLATALLVLPVLVIGLFVARKIRYRRLTLPPPQRHVESFFLAVQETAQPADAFVDSVGLCSSTTVRDSPDYFNRILLPSITDLGIRHLRASIPLTPNDPHVALLRELARHGCRTLLLTKLRHTHADDALSDPVTMEPMVVRDIVKAAGKAIEGVEGPNEYAHKNSDKDWTFPLHAYCQSLYKTLKADPATRHIPVVGPTLYSAEGRALGDYASLCDVGNVHIYDFPFPSPRNAYWKPILEGQRKPYTDKTLYMTEMGFNTATDPFTSVTESEKSRYLPRQLLRFFKAHYARSYIYELRDSGTDANDKEANFGLMRHDGERKPSYLVLHNLLHLLADPGSRFYPKTFGFEVSGKVDALQYLLLQKRNGDFYLLLWENTDGRLASENHPLNVKFQMPVEAATLFLLTEAPTPHPLPMAGNAVSVPVSDRPVVLQITPTTLR